MAGFHVMRHHLLGDAQCEGRVRDEREEEGEKEGEEEGEEEEEEEEGEEEARQGGGLDTYIHSIRSMARMSNKGGGGGVN